MLINNQKPVIHDVDVIFFDTNQNESKNRKYERTLSKKFPNYQWQVRNQVYMNSRASQNPYKSTIDAIGHFPERCTAIGAYLDSHDKLCLIAPYGVSDLMSFIVSPTPSYISDPQRHEIFLNRVYSRDWLEKWPNLKVKEK